VGEPLDSSSACLSCYLCGRLDMHGMKGFLSVLDVKADRIYHTVSAGNGIGD
jgi:hypothetical protein